MKVRFFTALIATLTLTSCNQEEFETLKGQNEDLQDEVKELSSGVESLQLEKTAVQAELSELKKTIKEDFVTKDQFDSLSEKLKTADAKVEAAESEITRTRKEIDSLEEQKKELSSQLDDLKNGADRLFAEAEKEFADDNYKLAKEKLATLLEKHPAYPQKNKVTDLAAKIAKKESLAETGDWAVKHYVDEFGERTGEGVIVQHFLGRMSNSATDDAELIVSVNVDKEFINFQLHPYGRMDSRETWYRREYWNWTVQNSEKKRFTLKSETGARAILFEKKGTTSYNALHDLLMKGGELKFVTKPTPRNSWSFTIPNADGFKKAWQALLAAED